MKKSVKTKKVPVMVAITITGENDRLFHALKKAMVKENQRLQAAGKEVVPYIINYSSTARP